MSLSELNPEQRRAVTTRRGPLLVLAGAGSGKTRVITFRIAELIRQGTPADRILAVTFTNKAAREMRERAMGLLGKKRGKARPEISTFHSLCVRILRRNIERLGYPSTFALYDQSEQEKKLRPLRGVAHERLDVFDHDRADVPGEDLRNSIQQSIGPGKIAPTLSRFLRLGPAVEINHAGNP